jgi:hypothetical protein
MNVDRQVSILESTLARQLAWIAAADAKTGFVFVAATAMLGLLASAAPAYGKWTALGVILSVLATTLLLASLTALVAAVFPRTHGPKLSIIFFGGIASRDVDAYRSDVQSLDEDAYAEDLIQQCHINAKIASTKYHWVKIASVFLALSVLPWAVTAYVLFRDK